MKLKDIVQRLPQWGGYLLALALVVFVSLLCPNVVSDPVQYRVGAYWIYDDLIAPTDIPILKSDEAYQAEVNAIKDNFSPFYEIENQISLDVRAQFVEKFDQQVANATQGTFKDVPKRPKVYREQGLQLATSLLEKGIVQLESQHEKQGKNFVITVLSGNTSQQRTVHSLLEPSELEALVTDSLFSSGLPEAEFLIPLFDGLLRPNLFYNDSLTSDYLQQEIAAISRYKGKLDEGSFIIKKGDLISPDMYQRLISYERNRVEDTEMINSYWSVFGGFALLASLVIGLLILFIQYNEPMVLAKFPRIAFILMWGFLYSYGVYLVEGADTISPYLIPFCIAPIVIKDFFNDRLALFSHIAIVLIASFLTSLGYEFTFLQILAGIVAVLINTETRYFGQFFRSIFLIFLTYILGHIGLSFIQGLTFETMDLNVFAALLGNAILLLLAYPLIPLLEKVFGFVSSITLVELADMNRPLLKALSVEAPGTLQHSLQVANLSEAAATRIGANAVLVKTAALYHDIGKMKNPTFFIENQSGENPHNQLPFEESAQKIIEHVSEGVRLARKHRLPGVLIRFIRTHHGTTRVEYFYRKYQEAHPDEEVDEKTFRYLGPKPSTKEETILMMADSIEAASKSLKNPTGQDIDELVEKIVNYKVSLGQFEESDLTFEEMELCKKEYKKLLRSIYHVRVEYPDEKKG